MVCNEVWDNACIMSRSPGRTLGAPKLLVPRPRYVERPRAEWYVDIGTKIGGESSLRPGIRSETYERIHVRFKENTSVKARL